MNDDSSVFEQTYQHYLAEISQRNLQDLEPILGIQVHDDKAIIHLFGRPYTVSANGILDSSGERPFIDICVILSKYILMCPSAPTTKKGWVSYRDFKDSGPLIKFYANDVEKAIAEAFSGVTDKLNAACDAMDGYAPALELSYDICRQFDALPQIPILLLFNDADEDFPASCSVLFQNDADKYLDAECLAMVGAMLASRLKKYG